VLTDPQTLTRLERLVSLARRVASPPSKRRLLRRPGRGIEPGARRDYTPGDDVRLVDWPAFARLERLLVKVPEDLPEPRLDLIVDGSGSTGRGDPTPHLRACLATAALAACAVAREVRTVVWWAGAPVARTALHRPGELVSLLRWLADREPGGGGALESTCTQVSETASSRGSAVLLSDGLCPSALPAALRLRNAGFEPLVVLAFTAAEVAPDLASAADQAGLAHIVDAETGASRQVPIGYLTLRAAGEARARRSRALLARLHERKIATATLAAEAPFEDVALGLLRG